MPDRVEPYELPMFPLGSVLLPGALLPLHVFEERYRVMVRRCLEGVPEFGVALIERGSEVGGGDVRSRTGCVARIVQAAEAPDGRFTLVCVGTRRIAVDTWLDDDPHPRALVEDWPDPAVAADLRPRLDEVVALLRRVLALAAELDDGVASATSEISDDPLTAVWHIAALAPLGPSDRQAVLAVDSAEDRLARLGDLLEEELDTLQRRLHIDGPSD